MGDLEDGSDKIEIAGMRTMNKDGKSFQRYIEDWTIYVSWDQLFADIGPALINEASETKIKSIISRFNSWDHYRDDDTCADAELSLESWNEIMIQLRALGYMVPGTKKRAVADRASYWKITARGDQHLVSLLARRKKTSGSSSAIYAVSRPDGIQEGTEAPPQIAP